jgi:hypothetical protein
MKHVATNTLCYRQRLSKPEQPQICREQTADDKKGHGFRTVSSNTGLEGFLMATTGSGQGQSPDRPGADRNGSIAQTVRETTYRQLDDQKARASDTLGSLAGAVRGMTEPLRSGGQSAVADYVTRAADGMERFAATLRQQEIEDAARAVQRFARRQPALFLGAAFTAGVVAARFLKSSSNDQRERWDQASHSSASPRTTGAGPMGTTDFGARQFGTPSGDIPRVPPDIRTPGEGI